MTIYFSHDPVAFWDSSVHANIPPGAVVVTEAQYASLLMGQAAGMVIVPSSTGAPILIDPPPVAQTVPASVSRFQACAALMQAGLLADVELAVAASSDPFTQLAWAESTEFPRNSPTIAVLAAALGLTDEQVDQLFITASQISA